MPRLRNGIARGRSGLLDYIFEDFQFFKPVTDEENCFVMEKVIEERQNAVFFAGPRLRRQIVRIMANVSPQWTGSYRKDLAASRAGVLRCSVG